MQRSIEPSEVQYLGIAEISKSCLLAVDTIVNSETPPRKASLVTYVKDRRSTPRQEEHLFLFWDWNCVPLTVVHSGFTSGYPGEGPGSFSQAMSMIGDKGIPSNWILVKKEIFEAIENRKLTSRLIDDLRKADDEPINLSHRITNRDQLLLGENLFWRKFHDPKLNSDWLDSELTKRCSKVFETDQEVSVVNAFKLVEERLREVTDEDNGYGIKLVDHAFHPENGSLVNQSLPKSEQMGIHELFRGAFGAFRNPVAHRFVDNDDEQFNIELIFMADLLLKLIDQAVEKVS